MWINSTPDQSESSDSWDWDNCTTALSSESTRPQSTSWEESSHTLPSVTHPDKQSESWSSREVTERLTSKEFLWPVTLSSSKFWASTESFAFKTWSTKSGLLVHTSRKPTTSCGHSSLEPQEEVSHTRDTPSKEEEIGVTENNSSTTWSLAWSD